MFLKNSNNIKCNSQNTSENHILQALVAQLCAQREREEGQERERETAGEKEDTDNGPQLRKQLGLAQKNSNLPAQ